MIKLRVNNLVRRRSDHKLFTAIGDCPFPVTGWNFCPVEKARFCWQINTEDRWITYNPADFDVLKSKP